MRLDLQQNPVRQQQPYKVCQDSNRSIGGAATNENGKQLQLTQLEPITDITRQSSNRPCAFRKGARGGRFYLASIGREEPVFQDDGGGRVISIPIYMQSSL
jgi:hypothetical protein